MAERPEACLTTIARCDRPQPQLLHPIERKAVMSYENLPSPLKHPDDDPKWEIVTCWGDWRRYISDEVRGMWNTFTTEQKAALIRQAEYMTSLEEFD